MNIFENTLLYIDEHIEEKISLSQLALQAGYSPFYFSKLFSEKIGIPLRAYIRIRKLQFALVDLLEGKKVLDVSNLYAFESHEGFSRSFKQLFGFTPSTARRFLKSYRVPDRNLLTDKKGETDMCNLKNDIHELLFEVLKKSLEEAQNGYCNKIQISLLNDNKIKIIDNGRGLPLTSDLKTNKAILDRILSGYPITKIEYAQMGDFVQSGLQAVNSLCESLDLKIYRDNICFAQNYIRGVAQHELSSATAEHH